MDVEGQSWQKSATLDLQWIVLGGRDAGEAGAICSVQVGERRRDEHVNRPKQMALRDAIFEPELAEQPALIPLAPPHHRHALPPLTKLDELKKLAEGGARV